MGPDAHPPRVRLSVLGAFDLRCDGRPVALPLSAQRVIAFLAVAERSVLRIHLAEALWPDGSQERAAANLRSSLWRLRRPRVRLVEARGNQLALAAEVEVDLHAAAAQARRLLDGAELRDAGAFDWTPLARELLPDWTEDWVLMEREHFRQLALHALETLAERQIAAGECRRAVDSAMTAVAGEPLRESAQRVLIRAHLAEGNAGEAVRQYRLYSRLLRERLGLEPSAQIRTLVAPLVRYGLTSALAAPRPA